MKSTLSDLKKQGERDHNSFLIDYNIIKDDYRTVKQQVEDYVHLVDKLQKENLDLTRLVNLYREEVESLRNR